MKKIYNRLLSTILVILTVIVLTSVSLAQHVNPKCCNYPAKPDAVKIQFFLEACAVPGESAKGMIPYFDCQSYILGIVDSYRQIKTSIPKENQICIPDNITARQVLELIWNKYPSWNIPEHRLAAEVIFEVLQKEFKCANQ